MGRSIQGFGLSPGITQEQRVGVETLFKGACQKFSGEKNNVPYNKDVPYKPYLVYSIVRVQAVE